MPIKKFRQVPDAEEVSDDTADPYYSTRYLSVGEDNIRIVEAYAAGAIPAFRLTAAGTKLYRQTPVVTRKGFRLYEVDVLYNRKPAFDRIVQFRTTGGTQKILGSLRTVATSTDAPDYKGLIGVNADGTVEGTEIGVPVQEWIIELSYPPGALTDPVINAWTDMSHRTNGIAWRGRGPREWLYLGAEGTQDFVAQSRVTHYYAAQPSLVNATIAGLAGINKKGWEFLWFLVEDKEVVAGGVTVAVKQAVHWYVEQVYFDGNFAAVFGP